MPRSARLQFEGAFYHIYSRGNRRQRIYWTPADYREFEELLLDAASRNEINLYQWRLMPNHFHMLVQTPCANLAVFMQRLLSAYARYFNRAHHQIGHLFQSRYGARLCDKEEYLLELVRYITLNAHRAKTWKRLVESGESHWSSHRYYLEGHEPITVQPFIHEVLRRFSEDLPTARRRYAAFIADGLSNRQAILSLPPASRFLGSETFIEESKRQAGQPVRSALRPPSPALDQWIQKVWERLGVSEAQLQSRSKDRRISAARRALVYAAKRRGHTTTALAQRLKQRLSTISQMYRIQENHPHDPVVQELMEI